MYIDNKEFTNALSLLPLISIDFIIKDSKDRVLLGLRSNPPAKGKWFVPGGRVRRMESINNACNRLTKGELGQIINISDFSLLGIFEHMYTDSAYSDDIGVHYISLGMCIKGINLKIKDLPRFQHTEYKWFTLEEIQSLDSVHHRTKDFFIEDIGLRSIKS